MIRSLILALLAFLFAPWNVTALRAQQAHYRWHDGVALNDPVITPGAFRTTNPDDAVIMGRASTRIYRHTTPEMKAEAYRLYGVDKEVVDRARFCTGIVKCDTDEVIAEQKKKEGKSFSLYEVDHVCSLELGCADNVRDLMPQPYYAHPGAHEKDDLENALSARLKSRKLLPADAQKLILADWYAAYLMYVKPRPRAAAPSERGPRMILAGKREQGSGS